MELALLIKSASSSTLFFISSILESIFKVFVISFISLPLHYCFI
nr:MAG TPA: hypothetical protein [Caudoviricetes sp.]